MRVDMPAAKGVAQEKGGVLSAKEARVRALLMRFEAPARELRKLERFEEEDERERARQAAQRSKVRAPCACALAFERREAAGWLTRRRGGRLLWVLWVRPWVRLSAHPLWALL